VVAGRRRASLHAAQLPWRSMRRRIHDRCSSSPGDRRGTRGFGWHRGGSGGGFAGGASGRGGPSAQRRNPGGGSLPGGGAELGARLGAGAAQGACGGLLGVAAGHVQPEPAGARGPQLLPVALRHPGHPDLRTSIPPGPALPCPGSFVVRRPPYHGLPELIRTSLGIPIGFILPIDRLTRMSRPCRSRYATIAIRSPSTDRRRRPGGAPPAGRCHPSPPPRPRICQAKTGGLTSRNVPRGGCNRHGEGLHYPSGSNRCS
jgi:hypothetical protein